MTGPQRKALYTYQYRRSRDQDARAAARHPVVIVGAGPVGLTAALDLASRGVAVVVLDDSDRIGDGSRGICWAKRTLEIWDRLGIGEEMVARGVTWKLGKVFLGDEQVYSFDLLPEDGHKMPAFINLQQFHVEHILVERAQQTAAIDLRWKNKVTALERRNDGVRLTVDTPEGAYSLDADWVIAADGARSALRDMLGLTFAGHTFEEKFLIVDVHMHADDIPTERRFWFDPPFHSGQSALLHRQPDDCWRVDLQLGADADVEEELKPERYLPRIRRVLDGRDFDVDWISIYRFNCRRIERFVHDRVIFIGDSAHQLSPFGARGANSGIQDADNLGWKLAAVLAGTADARLIDSYNDERTQAADENIGHSTRSTDFIAPRSPAERDLRNAILSLAPHADFARRMVNSGRLSVATVYDTPLNTPDETAFAGSARLGAPIPDVPVTTAKEGSYEDADFLLRQLPAGFVLLMSGGEPPRDLPPDITPVVIGGDLADDADLFRERFDATPGAAYLVRPDQHLAGRWRHADAGKIRAARDRALARI